MKRLFDMMTALIGIIILAIPMLLIALLVRLTSKGPALYWSDRVGKDNRVFRMPKFRSMKVDAPEMGMHLIRDATKSCVTPFGSFLRKTSLDEFPQLWSILIGHMSFVGPRPVLPNEEVLVALRSMHKIHTIRPGLTGWAQINGRAQVPVNEKVQLDAEYLNRQSLMFDLNILFRTALKVVVRSHVGRDEAKICQDETAPQKPTKLN